jgi:hypothetical protein
MFIRIKDPSQREFLMTRIESWLKNSRFDARIELHHHYRWKYVIRISNIRLRHSKPYCGQHPGPCVNLFFVRKTRNGCWLEGADWVGWNDGLNSVLDELSVDAEVWSHCLDSERCSRFMIRKGKARRVDYESTSHGTHEVWVAEGTFEDWCGRKAPTSTYPQDTPGIADWRPEAEDEDGCDTKHSDDKLAACN